MGVAELVALVFDEYDAGRADVMFVIQRVLRLMATQHCWIATK